MRYSKRSQDNGRDYLNHAPTQSSGCGNVQLWVRMWNLVHRVWAVKFGR